MQVTVARTARLQNFGLALFFITALFLIWAFVTKLLDPLFKSMQVIFTLSDFKGQLKKFAFLHRLWLEVHGDLRRRTYLNTSWSGDKRFWAEFRGRGPIAPFVVPLAATPMLFGSLVQRVKRPAMRLRSG